MEIAMLICIMLAQVASVVAARSMRKLIFYTLEKQLREGKYVGLERDLELSDGISKESLISGIAMFSMFVFQAGAVIFAIKSVF